MEPGRDRLRDLLQDDRLAGARRRDDQRALPHAHRRDQVDDAHGHVLVLVAHELERLVRADDGEFLERRDFLRLGRVHALDLVDRGDHERLVTKGLAQVGVDHLALAQAVLDDEAPVDVRVGVLDLAVALRIAQEPVALLREGENPLDRLDRRRIELRAATAPAAPAAPPRCLRRLPTHACLPCANSARPRWEAPKFPRGPWIPLDPCTWTGRRPGGRFACQWRPRKTLSAGFAAGGSPIWRSRTRISPK